MSKRDHPTLFDELPFDWESEWWGMPEFKMGNTEPVQRITINFRSHEDVREFAYLIGQRITARTDSLWYPRDDSYVAPSAFRYVDES